MMNCTREIFYADFSRCDEYCQKGVKTYVGWNGYVDLSYSDRAILTLARNLYVDKMTVKDSVEEVMREVGPDPLYKSVLEYRSG
jgi:hypothetical protein